MNVLEKIQEAVRSLNEPTQLYKEARLDDGRTVATEADEFSAGAEVKVIGDDGSTSKLEAGTHKLEEGSGFTVDADGRIALEEHEEKELEKDDEKELEKDEKKEDLAKHEDEKEEKKLEEEDKKEELEYEEVLAALVSRFEVAEEKAKEIAAFVSDVYKVKEVEAGGHEEEEKKKEEMSADFAAFAKEVNNGFEAILTRLQRLEEEPGAEPAAVTPEGFADMVGSVQGKKKQEFSNQSIQDRVRNSIFQNV